MELVLLLKQEEFMVVSLEERTLRDGQESEVDIVH